MTFLSVALAWVLFRADSLAVAGKLYAAMAGVHGSGSLPHGNLVGWLILGALGVFLLPTSQQWAGIADVGPARFWRRIAPLPATGWAATALALLAFGAILQVFAHPAAEFIYFNF